MEMSYIKAICLTAELLFDENIIGERSFVQMSRQ